MMTIKTCKLVFFCSFAFIGFYSFAQNSKSELWSTYQNKKNHDTVRLKSLQALIYQHYLYANPDTARIIARSSYQLAKKPKLEKYLGDIYAVQGITYSIQGDQNSALFYFDSAYAVFEKANIVRGMISILSNKGIANMYLGNMEESLKMHNESYELAVKFNFPELQASALTNSGLVLNSNGEVKRALENYFKALKITEKVRDTNATINLLINIAIVNNDLRKNHEAIVYLKKANALATKRNNLVASVKTQANLGVLMYDLANIEYVNNPDSFKKYILDARKYFIESLDIYKILNDENGIAISLTNIGNTYMSLKNDSSMYYYQKSLEISLRNQDAANNILNYSALSNFYLKKNLWSKVKEYAGITLKLANEIGNLSGLKMANYRLFLANKNTGNYKEGLRYYQEYIKLEDSLSSSENEKAITRQELAYEYEKKQAADSVKQIEGKKATDAQLKSEKSQRIVLYGGLLLTSVFAFFAFNRFRITKKQKVLIENSKMEVELQKKMIDEKQKEIIDSIHYAKRIQTALVTSDYNFKNMLNKSKL